MIAVASADRTDEGELSDAAARLGIDFLDRRTSEKLSAKTGLLSKSGDKGSSVSHDILRLVPVG